MDSESRDAAEVERLHEYGERLSEAKDKSQLVSEYKEIIMAVKGSNTKAKHLAAQLIPLYFKFFPDLVSESIHAMFDLVKDDQLVEFPEDRKLSLLQNFAEITPSATTQDSHELLPSVFELLNNYLTQSAKEDSYISYVECLVFTFHQLAYKSPNTATDCIGHDCSPGYIDFIRRLDSNDTAVRTAFDVARKKKQKYREQMSTAKTESDKAEIQVGLEKATSSLTMFNNVLMMTQPLFSKSLSFTSETNIRLSWMEPMKPSPASNATAAIAKRINCSGAVEGPPLKKKALGEGGFSETTKDEGPR